MGRIRQVHAEEAARSSGATERGEAEGKNQYPAADAKTENDHRETVMTRQNTAHRMQPGSWLSREETDTF